METLRVRLLIVYYAALHAL